MTNKHTFNVGTKILFENDRVRIWDFQLKPGESTDLHKHIHDYAFIYVTPDNDLSINAPFGQSYVQDTRPDGHVSYVEVEVDDPQMTHMATNTGNQFHRQIVIEFLDRKK